MLNSLTARSGNPRIKFGNMLTCSPAKNKIAKTCNLFLAFVSIGLNIAILGPTMLDLESMINKHGLSGILFATMTISYGLGSLIGGAMMDYFSNKQLILTCFGFVCSISLLMVPWSGRLELLSFLMVLLGITLGALESGGNIWCVQLYKEKHGPVLQSIYFGLGLGTFIGPIMAAPLVTPYATPNGQEVVNNEKILLDLNYNGSTANGTSIPSQKSILYIYCISGAFTLFVTLLFCIVGLMTSEENSIRSENKQTKTVKRWVWWTVILVSFFINLFGYGVPLGSSQMLTTYLAKGKLHLSKSKGSYITSVFRLSLMTGSLICYFVVKKMKALSLALVFTMISLSGSILLLINGLHSEWSLWLGTTILGFGASPVLPCSISWTDELATINHKISGLYIIAMACGMVLSPVLTDHLMAAFPEILFYIIFFSTTITLACTLALYFVERKTVSRSNQIVLKQLTQLYSIS